MAKRSIRFKLSLSYSLFILLFVLFITILSNLIIQREFINYAKGKQTNQIKKIIDMVSNQYDNGYNASSIELIADLSLEEGYIIAVTNNENRVIYDALIHNGHQCQMIIADIENRMRANFLNWNGEYVTNTYELPLDTGEIRIGYFSPYFYTEDEMKFLSTLNTIYIFSSILFIIVALILSKTLAKRLSQPLERVVLATENIARGKYDKLELDSDILEVERVTHAINTLSNTLKRENEYRKQMTLDISHELRTPLTTLNTHVEGMIEGVLEVDKEQLSSIQEEILRLTKIVSDLDQLVNFDYNEESLNKEQVNLGQLIENVVNLFRVQFEAKGIKISFERKDLSIYIDKVKMTQVLVNLLSNAWKYTEQGEVKVKIEESNESVSISVIDTGIGISEESIPHIFNRFYRVDKSRNRSTGGAGIGLAIVSEIIAAHKGVIDVKSTVGVGTEFRIELPKV